MRIVTGAFRRRFRLSGSDGDAAPLQRGCAVRGPGRFPLGCRMGPWALIVVALLTVGIASCADGDEVTEAEDATVETGEPGTKPDTSGILAADRGEPPASLEIVDLVVGDGPTVEAGDVVEVQYVGLAWSTGEEFGSSWDSGRSFQFTLGSGGVIAGWDQGVPGMQVGGRRMLTIPPDLAYGDRGAGGRIAPGETLVFVVDVVSVVG